MFPPILPLGTSDWSLRGFGFICGAYFLGFGDVVEACGRRESRGNYSGCMRGMVVRGAIRERFSGIHIPALF